MRFFKNLFEKKAEVSSAQPALRQEVISDSAWNRYILGEGSAILSFDVALSMYQENATVATAIDMIARPIENMSLVVLDREAGEYVNNSNTKALLGMLEQPNGFETQTELIGSLTRHYCLTGNFFLLAVGLNEPVALYAVYPTLVNIEENPVDKYPDKYLIYDGIGRDTYTREAKARSITRFLNITRMKELYHAMGFVNSVNNISGSSPLEAAAADVRQQIAGRVHNYALLKNGGHPTLVITYKDVVPPVDSVLKQREKLTDRKIAGPENAGKIITTSSAGGMEVSELGRNNKDMDYYNLEKISSMAIYNRYNIPLPLISNEASTFSNYENSMPYFYYQTVLPTADIILNNLSKVLCPRYRLDPQRYIITYDINKIETLSKYKLDQLKLRKEINIETVNEMREQLPNRGPVKNGDSVIVKMTDTKLDDLGVGGTAEL